MEVEIGLGKGEDLGGHILVAGLEPADAAGVILLVGTDVLKGKLSFADATHTNNGSNRDLVQLLELGVEAQQVIIPANKMEGAFTGSVVGRR